MVLLLLALSCSSSHESTPWWLLGDQACPRGAVLTGEAPPPQSVVPGPPPESFYDVTPGWEVQCELPGGVLHGRSSSWYGHGQLARSMRLDHGLVVESNLWSQRGRVIRQTRCEQPAFPSTCTQHIQRWHEDGTLGLEGDLRGEEGWNTSRGMATREGTWRAWDEKGRLVGDMDFEGGVVTEVRKDSPLLRYGDLDVGPGIWSDERPHSTSVLRPEQAVHVVVDQREITVDGVRVLVLTRIQDERAGVEVTVIPSDEKRGHLVSRLYDRLVEKRDIAEELYSSIGKPVPGDIVLDVGQEAVMATLREMLYTAQEAGFDDLHFATQNPATFVPPLTGPELLRGPHTLHSVDFRLLPPGLEPELGVYIEGEQTTLVAGEWAQAYPHTAAGEEQLAQAVQALRAEHPAWTHASFASHARTPVKELIKAADLVQGDYEKPRFQQLYLVY